MEDDLKILKVENLRELSQPQERFAPKFVLFEVVFISSIFYFLFGPLSLSLKFEEDPMSGC